MNPNLEPPPHSSHDTYMDESSNSSTPFVSAPSSPTTTTTTTTTISGYYYSAPTSPMHYILTSPPTTTTIATAASDASSNGSFEFDFSYRFESSTTPSSPANRNQMMMMSSADELFLDGKIRPMKLSSHLDADEDDDDVILQRSRDMHARMMMRMRSRSQHRRARSMSPLRSSTPVEWITSDDVITPTTTTAEKNTHEDADVTDTCPKEGSASTSTSSSRCSSAGRSSKRWVFLKDFLRSKSEGRSNNKFWHNLSLKEKKAKDSNTESHGFLRKKIPPAPTTTTKVGPSGKGKRRSAHEMHYTANRAQAEEMRKKTYLPYKQGLLGCLGFNSKSYGALHGFARALNPVSSR